MRAPALAMAVVLMAATAAAQTPYVAGTIGADILRSDRTESNQYSSPSSDREVLSGSLRLGTSIGESWGVELEFVKSGQSRGPAPGPVPLFADVSRTGMTGATTTGSFPIIPGLPEAIPSPIFVQSDVRQSHYDFDTVAWIRQRAGSSVDLIYLGGLVFSRQRVEMSQTFPTVLRIFAPGGGTFRTTVIDYSTHPLAGAEARVALTTHLRLLPGIRVQGHASGWLVRPYAGLGWFF